METGLDKILNKIETDCENECTNIITKSEEEVHRIIDDAVSAAEKKKKTAIEKTNKECENMLMIAVKNFEMERRNAILQAKSDYISGVIKEALNYVNNLPINEYFDIIKKLIINSAQNGVGKLHFSKKDYDRIPNDFLTEVNIALHSEEKRVVLSEETYKIDDGFIIEYHNIDINCTFDSLLSTSVDEIKEKVYIELFL